MKTSSYKMILVLGLAGIFLGVGRYMHQEIIISNVIKQFQYSSLSSMKFFVFIDEKNDHPKVLINSLKQFLNEAKALSSDKKVSLSVITSARTPEQTKNTIEALKQNYPSFYTVESTDALLSQEKHFKLPRFLIENPSEEVSQQILKLLLLNSNEQAVFITSANMFPYSYQPVIGKNHLSHALQLVNSLKHGIVFCQIYSAPAIIGSKEIFFIDQQFLLRCFDCVQIKILQELALMRLQNAQEIFSHTFLTKNEHLSLEQYEHSIQNCISSYNKNPSLFLGAQALQKWSVGDIFYDQMAIEYKAIGLLNPVGPSAGSDNSLISKGCWSADVAKRFLKKEHISALIASIIISEDYNFSDKTQAYRTDRQNMLTLYEKYRSQLSNDEVFILHDVCENNALESLYNSKISA